MQDDNSLIVSQKDCLHPQAVQVGTLKVVPIETPDTTEKNALSATTFPKVGEAVRVNLWDESLDFTWWHRVVRVLSNTETE